MVTTSCMNSARGPVVLPGRRLVEDQRRGLQREGDGKGQALLLPERERERWTLADVLERVERRSAQSVVHDRVERFRGRLEVPRAELSSSRTVFANSIWLGLWKTKPKVVASSATVRSAIDAPSTSTSPPRVGVRPIAVRSSVVLPDPFGPSTATTSFAPSLALTPWSTSRSPQPARTSRNSSRGGRSPAWARAPGIVARCARPMPQADDLPGPPSAESVEHDLERELHGDRVGDLEEAGDVAEVPGSALVQVQDAIRPKVERLLDAVLDDHHRVAFVGEAPERREEALGGERIEVRERLVHHEEPRMEHEDAGHREELALAAGQVGRLAAEERLDARRLGDVWMRRQISPRSMPRFSGPKAISASTVAPTIWRAGSWSSVPTLRAISRSFCSVVGLPPTRTVPVSSPG